MTWRLQFRLINHSISSRVSKAQLSYAFDQWGDAFYEEGRVGAANGYPPGNDHISHCGKRKIIFKSAFFEGYVSSLQGKFLPRRLMYFSNFAMVIFC